MCVAVPARVKTADPAAHTAIVEVGGAQISIRTDLVDEPQPEEWVLVHAGFALEKLDEATALETLDLLQEMWGQEGLGAPPD